MATYLFGTVRLSSDDAAFASALAMAHADRLRPKCLCAAHGAEMYVASLGDGFIVKRMPGTGSLHAATCPSYEPPPSATGLGQVLGTAIREDPATGETALRLAFSMSKLGGRTNAPAPGTPPTSVAGDGTRLSLRGLLHYLWDQGKLTRWHPGFAGRRTWAIVRRQLLIAADNKVARGVPLRSRLYVPEPFSSADREAINGRRAAQWSHAAAAQSGPQQLMVLIGEVKEIVPARYGYRAVIKHVPDQAFALDEQMYWRLGRSFEAELALWGSTDSVHMVAIATFSVSVAGVPTVLEMSLMPVTPQWLPVEDAFELQLVERLVTEGRGFVKGLRYNLHRGQSTAAATLIDMGDSGPLLFVVPPHMEASDELLTADGGVAGVQTWTWRPLLESMPELPTRQAS